MASAVSSEGEQLYPRNWNFHFIGLPVIDEKKQRKPSFTTTEVEQILARAKGRYKVLFALLAGTGLRIGEALGLRNWVSICPATSQPSGSDRAFGEAPSRLPKQTTPSGRLMYQLLWQRS